MTAAPRHAFGLDLVRAVAVSSVLLAHGSLLFAEAHQGARYLLVVFGVVGVEIFFALSGFLVGRQLLLVAEGRAGAGRFLLRRWYRTLPNYYLFLGVNAALAAWVLAIPGPDAGYLVFAQSLAGPAARPFFPESWSLAIEEWFYLLAAIGFALAAWRRLSPGALGAILAAIVVTGPLLRYGAQLAAALPFDAGVRKVSLLRLDALAYGLGCAWIERYRPAAFARLAAGLPRALSAAIAAACAVALVLLARRMEFVEVPRSDALRWVAALLFSALPLATALWLPWLARWDTWRSPLAAPVRKLSEWSYALYLTHFPLLLVLLSRWPVDGADAVGLVLRAAAWASAAIALAAFVYRWYEHPLTMLRPSLAARGRDARRRHGEARTPASGT